MNKRVELDGLGGEKFYDQELPVGAARKRKERRTPEPAGAKGGIPFQFKPLGSIAPVRRSNWLIKGLMPAHGLHVIYGQPGAGKSFVSIHAALHISAGLPWAGRKVSRCGVVYVASEGADAIATRIAAARKHLDVPHDAPFALVTEAPLMTQQRGDTDRLIASVREQSAMLSCPPGVIFLDTLSRSIPGLDENKSGDMMTFVDRAKELARALDVLVVPVHHCGKDEDKGMRGSSALHGATDAEWLLKRDGDHRHIHVQKMRDGPDRQPLGFELERVTLGKDDDGDPLETCVMRFTERLPTETRLPGNEQVVLDALKVLTLTEGRAEPGAPTGRKSVDEKRLKSILADSGLLHNVRGSSLGTLFPRYLETLKKAGRIGRDEGSVWLVDAAA